MSCSEGQVKNVFEGKGFLSNYASDKRMFPTSPCGIIALRNPVKLLKRIEKDGHFYDRRLFEDMISGKVPITQDQDIVFSDWKNKIYHSIEELWREVKNDSTWKYEEYAK